MTCHSETECQIKDLEAQCWRLTVEITQLQQRAQQCDQARSERAKQIGELRAKLAEVQKHESEAAKANQIADQQG